MVENQTLMSLESLDVSGCGLGWEAVRRLLLAASGGRLRSLTALHLASNYIDTGGVMALAVAISSSELPALTTLRLDLSGIDDQAALALAHALGDPSCCPQLRRLDMGKNTSLNGHAWQVLMTGPGLPSALQDLSLANCTRLGPEGTAALLAWVSLRTTPPCLLRTLNLTNTGVGTQGALALAQGLAQSRLPHLQSLILRSDRLGPEGLHPLSQALRGLGRSCRLETLDLSDNGLGDEGGFELAETLRDANSLPDLRRLGLADNDLKGEGSWPHLAEALVSRARLEELDVSKNPLGLTHAEDRALGGLMQRLKCLKLAWTDLQEGAALALAARLATSPSPTVTSLDLAYCPLGPKGTSKLLELAFTGHFPCLRTLSLVGTCFTDPQALDLSDLLQRVESGRWAELETVDLRGNELGREGKRALHAAMAAVRSRLREQGIWGLDRRIHALLKV